VRVAVQCNSRTDSAQPMLIICEIYRKADNKTLKNYLSMLTCQRWLFNIHFIMLTSHRKHFKN